MASADDSLITITDPAEDRYARTRLIYRQEVIEQARMMVVGAGALGNEVLKNLALLGARHLFIVDLDTIEASNLTRSVLFRYEDRGRPKAVVAAERVRALNPDLRPVAFHGDVTCDVGLGVFRQMDVVIGCLDNRAARLAVNRACWRVGRPWIDGGLSLADGSVQTFVPPKGACYECLMTRQDYALLNVRYACPPASIRSGLALTTPMSASLVGAMQVQEAIKLLHGEPVPGGRGVFYSAQGLAMHTSEYPRRADCPAHRRFDPVLSLPVRAADLTVGELVALAVPQVGPKAVIVLPETIVKYVYCRQCDRMEKVFEPLRLATPRHAICPQCKADQVFDAGGTVAAAESTRGLPITQLGIAPYDIVEIRAGRQQVFVELSGDHEQVLAGWQRGQQQNG